MFWADTIAEQIVKSGKYKTYWVDDMKTPSGYSHVGSLMGPIIHSMIFRALKGAGQKAEFTFVINDFDPADDLLPEIKGTDFEEELGKPLRLAKSPDSKFKSMADLFGSDFINAIQSLGVEAKILSSWDLYHEGKFDGVIKDALDSAERIQDIYQEISGSRKKAAGWFPFQVVCEKCQKLGTTRVFAWDGDRVSYKCEPNLVKWATGCGYEGKVSPFEGNGKLPWKIDWGAHWKVIGVTVEAAGKDHASAGGSYDIAMALCKEVFKYDPPFRLPYEFILIGGKKMSSSKGIGIKAHDLVKILPPQLGRFLFARNGIKSQTNFDPEGTNAIPVLFDDYQKAADAYFNKEDNDLAKAFEYSQIGEVQKPPSIRFSVLSQWVQMPNMEEEVKKQNLEAWAKYAKQWVEKFAPEKDKFSVQEEVPEIAKNFSGEQKKFLQKVSEELDKKWDAEEFQQELYEWSKELEVNSKDAFSAIYLSLIGKDHGPKAGWFILSLDKDFVKKRFNEVV
jgi:lysyl-tRNA synthetase, class I